MRYVILAVVSLLAIVAALLLCVVAVVMEIRHVPAEVTVVLWRTACLCFAISGSTRGMMRKCLKRDKAMLAKREAAQPSLFEDGK